MNKPYSALAASAFTLLALAGCSSASAGDEATPTPTQVEARLSAVLGDCDLRYQDGATLGDAGESLTLDGRGQDDFDGLDYDLISCALTSLDIPDATLNLVETTRALDGRQTASWDGFDATWSYHPDTGMNVTLVDTEFEAA